MASLSAPLLLLLLSLASAQAQRFGGACGQYQEPCSDFSQCVDPTCDQRTMRINPGGCRCEYGTARNPSTNDCVPLQQSNCQQYGMGMQQYNQMYQGQRANFDSQSSNSIGINYNEGLTGYNPGMVYQNSVGQGIQQPVYQPTPTFNKVQPYYQNQNQGQNCPQPMVPCQAAQPYQQQQQYQSSASLCAQPTLPCPRPQLVQRVVQAAPRCGCGQSGASTAQPAYCQPQTSPCSVQPAPAPVYQPAPVYRPAPVVQRPAPVYRPAPVAAPIVQPSYVPAPSPSYSRGPCPTGMNYCGQQQTSGSICARPPMPCPRQQIAQRVASQAPNCGCRQQQRSSAYCQPRTTATSPCSTAPRPVPRPVYQPQPTPYVAPRIQPRPQPVIQQVPLPRAQSYPSNSCPTRMNACPCSNQQPQQRVSQQTLCCPSSQTCPPPVMAQRMVGVAPMCNCNQAAPQPSYCRPCAPLATPTSSYGCSGVGCARRTHKKKAASKSSKHADTKKAN